MAKQFYRQGEKIFEAGSDRYIDMPEWQSDWSGQSSEVSAPAPSASSIEKKVADTGSSVFANTSSDSNQFNTAMGDLLKSFKGVGTADLLKRKNAILKAKYGRAAEITPEELRTLSPAQQAQVRGGKTEALDPELSSVKGQILDREQGISNFKDIFNMARGLSNDMATRERQIKADAQNTLTGMMELGSGAFDQFSDDDLNQMGSAAGYPAGFLKTAVDNLNKAGAQPDKIVSGPGSSTYAIYFDKDGKIRTETIIAPQYAPKSGDTTKITTTERVSELNGYLKDKNLIGGDNKVSYETYSAMKQTWLNNGGNSTTFTTNFPIGQWLDKDNQREYKRLQGV